MTIQQLTHSDDTYQNYYCTICGKDYNSPTDDFFFTPEPEVRSCAADGNLTEPSTENSSPAVICLDHLLDNATIADTEPVERPNPPRCRMCGYAYPGRLFTCDGCLGRQCLDRCRSPVRPHWICIDCFSDDFSDNLQQQRHYHNQEDEDEDPDTPTRHAKIVSDVLARNLDSNVTTTSHFQAHDTYDPDAAPPARIFMYGTTVPQCIFAADHWIFTTVRGTYHYGLLVDPGASRGLIGMDTLRDIIHYILRPLGLHKQVLWYASNAKFAGISPTQESALARCVIPIGLLGVIGSTYGADVIGGQASRCPGLVPLRTLLKHQSILLCGYFHNGDGIIAVKQREQYHAQRLLLTDSGHYLLEIDKFNQQSCNKLNNATRKHMQHLDLTNVNKQQRQRNDRDHSLSLVCTHSDYEETDSVFH